MYEKKSESSEYRPTVEKNLTPKSNNVCKVYKSWLVSNIVYTNILPRLVQQIGQTAEYHTIEIIFQ
jgi:hypothetical protein